MRRIGLLDDMGALQVIEWEEREPAPWVTPPDDLWPPPDPDLTQPRGSGANGGMKLEFRLDRQARLRQILDPETQLLPFLEYCCRPDGRAPSARLNPGRSAFRDRPEMMTLRQVEVIRAVMVTGTIGGAAKLFNVSAPGHQPPRQNTPRRSLGIRFFQRQNGRYFPTPEAENIFEQINGVYKKVDDLSEHHLQDRARRPLRSCGSARCRASRR